MVVEQCTVNGQPKPDISVSGIRLPREIYPEKDTIIEVSLRNESAVDIKECWATIEISDGFSDKKRLSLGPNAQERISFSWQPKQEGPQKITVIAETENDANPGNNRLSETCEIMRPEEIRPAITPGDEPTKGSKEREDIRKGFEGIIEKER